MLNIFLTGASGFLGSRIATVLKANSNCNLTVVTRKSFSAVADHVFNIPLFDSNTDWGLPLIGQDVVVHVAGIAHASRDSKFEFQRVNVDATVNLAKQAAIAGVKRFIFISSIGVNGYINNHPFTETDVANPSNLYAWSKWKAELDLWEIQRQSCMELVIIRPPLIYGPNAPGSFGSLLRMIQSGIPLPFGAITNNKRSFIALDNLVDVILLCADKEKSPNAANQVFLISDGEDVSTTKFIKKILKAFGLKSFLLPLPVSFMRIVAKLVGKSEIADRLLGNLQVDSTKARELLGWKPVVTMDEQLRITAELDRGLGNK